MCPLVEKQGRGIEQQCASGKRRFLRSSIKIPVKAIESFKSIWDRYVEDEGLRCFCVTFPSIFNFSAHLNMNLGLIYPFTIYVYFTDPRSWF